MKKSILLFAVALGVLTACDPIKDEKDLALNMVSSSALDGCVTITQVDENGNPASDGNYFNYVTSPATIISVYNLKADGSENLLAFGSSGTFVIRPSRGADPNQTYYLRVVNTDGSTTIVERTANVYVQQELDPEIRFFASDKYGSKVWYWDPSVTGAVWGNMGYLGGKGSDVGISGAGQWWGVSPDDNGDVEAGFLDQLQHTPDGKAHGDESINSYMVFDEAGGIKSYNKAGEVIREGSYSIVNFDMSNPDAWKVGDLVTNAILWPYEINSGGNVPGTYEIVYLTADKMTLVYPDGGAYGDLGNWGEATFWHFRSFSDLDGMAVGYGKTASKAWGWDSDITGAVWGNMGYLGGKGSDVGTSGAGQWWGVAPDESGGLESGFGDQLQHTPDNKLHGDESFDAYFSLSADGIIKRVAANGSVINSGSYTIEKIDGNEWKVGMLSTTPGTILWPYEINSGGNTPSEFEIVYLTNDKMTLVYPDGGAYGDLGNWGEATFWHFKAK